MHERLEDSGLQSTRRYRVTSVRYGFDLCLSQLERMIITCCFGGALTSNVCTTREFIKHSRLRG
jgi:hypothetical protein